jgi:hypothetical protein
VPGVGGAAQGGAGSFRGPQRWWGHSWYLLSPLPSAPPPPQTCPQSPPPIPAPQEGREQYTSAPCRWGAVDREDITAAAFAPGGWLLAGTAAGRLLQWDASAGRCVRVFEAHPPVRLAPKAGGASPNSRAQRSQAVGGRRSLRGAGAQG